MVNLAPIYFGSGYIQTRPLMRDRNHLSSHKLHFEKTSHSSASRPSPRHPHHSTSHHPKPGPHPSRDRTPKKQQGEVVQLLRQSNAFYKEESRHLHHLLLKKNRKIADLRQTISTCPIKCSQGEGKGQPQVRTEETLKSSRRAYEQMIKESKELAQQSLQKYRLLERKFEEERQKYQEEIERLRSSALPCTQLERTEATSSKKRIKSSRQSSLKKGHLSEGELGQLKALREKEKAWNHKERELLQMLGAIGERVSHFQRNLLENEDKERLYRRETEDLKKKLQSARENNSRLKGLFRELMGEAVSKSREVEEARQMLKNLLKKEERSMRLKELIF